jgi:tetratricopeptide (TPR) repeat protein
MANQPNDHLYQLIKSLTKAEKRAFKIYATRNSTPDAKFIKLFDAIDKVDDYDEDAIIKSIKEVKKRQFSNLKAHLYKQILTSLRLTNINHNVDIMLREQIDHARILYNKGLYNQSLRLLDKAKSLAHQNHRHSLEYEILTFERIIESQYITRSLKNRADELIEQSEKKLKTLSNYTRLSNLSLRLYGIYIKAGHVRDETDYENISRYFKKELEDIDQTGLGFFEQLYLYVSYAWYSLIVQDFLLQYRYAQKWVDLFHDNPDMLELEPIWYLKGQHVLLEALFILGHYKKHETVRNQLEEFVENPPTRTNENLETLGFMYLYTSKINGHFIAGTFSEGVKMVPELNQKIQKYSQQVDPHRILVFYYKIACLYFGAGNSDKAIEYLNKIINYPDQKLREDLHCFARILNLIAHYELGNQTHVEYQIRSVYRFLRKMNDLNLVQQEILKFLQDLGKANGASLKEKFKKLRKRLLEINDMPYQKRPFLYLDIISWLESKINEKPVQDIISGKFTPRS